MSRPYDSSFLPPTDRNHRQGGSQSSENCCDSIAGGMAASDSSFGIKTGDSVILKSGGPLMTVQSRHFDDVRCAWFDGNDSLGSGEFHYSTLLKSS